MPAKAARRELTLAQRHFLEALFPGEQCLFDAESMLVYGVDACRQRRMPWAVVRPTSEAQLVALLRWAQVEGVPLTPRARATNTVGGCVPVAGGVVVSLLGMNRILEIDDRDFVAVVEPGVITGHLQQAVEARGLFYPPDPASGRMSTIGGNVATCAGGMRALKYGVTRDHVLGLRAVLPGGEIIETGGRTHKNVVGLDLTRLLAGSEGTLAVLSRIIVKLQPKPMATASLMAGYTRMADALEAARAVFAAGLLPAAMEFLGQGMCRCLEQLMPAAIPWPASTNAVLLLRLDGEPECLGASLRRVRGAVEPLGPVFLEQATGEQEEALWDIRRSINPASFKAGSLKLSDDVTLPRGRVLEALTRFEEIGAAHDVRVIFAGHLGDGNMHVSVMHEPGQEDAARQAKAAIQEVALSLGGSLSGEHGIGLMKLPFVGKQLGEVERRLMREIKQAFDPRGILNPGKAY